MRCSAVLLPVACGQTYPAGKITAVVDVLPGTSCKAHPLISYDVSKWTNGVVGYDSPQAIYGNDDLSDIMKVHEWAQTLESGTYVVDGPDPLMYVCAFSPSEGYPPLFKQWHMCGCCYQLNALNASNFIGYCEDSTGVCESMCTVTASGTQADRHYHIHVGKETAVVV
mmetsp:Transcript_5282/g.12584  ORF Transcript_5282/g.12584 Transcript_5282/m.12584 type:complete len:168 (-) Transcript_5282:50-553(-)